MVLIGTETLNRKPYLDGCHRRAAMKLVYCAASSVWCFGSVPVLALRFFRVCRVCLAPRNHNPDFFGLLVMNSCIDPSL